MDKILTGATTFEGLVASLFAVAIAIILRKPLLDLMSGRSDPMASQFSELTSAVRENTEAVKSQERQFEHNNILFERVVETIDKIHTEIIRGAKP